MLPVTLLPTCGPHMFLAPKSKDKVKCGKNRVLRSQWCQLHEQRTQKCHQSKCGPFCQRASTQIRNPEATELLVDSRCPQAPHQDLTHAAPSSEGGTQVSTFTPQHWDLISLKGLQSIDETGHVTGLSSPSLSSLGAKNPKSADFLLKSHVQKCKGAHFGK